MCESTEGIVLVFQSLACFIYIFCSTVICFLATFLLEDLGLRCFSKIIKSLDAVKMHKVNHSHRHRAEGKETLSWRSKTRL